jgi:hypothetical protein
MREMIDATWRALAYCWHPLALLWSLLPLGLAAGASSAWAGIWLGAGGGRRAGPAGAHRAAGGAVRLARGHRRARPAAGAGTDAGVALVVPAVVLGTLLLVAWLLAPAMARLVVRRRFPGLQRSPGAAGSWGALGWSLLCALAALLALILSVPLWLVPPLIFVLPPLVWGWLCYRVLSFDALARHADAAERRFILHHHRWPLRAAGLLCGALCALPTLLWAVGASALVLAPLLMPLLVWLYTVVFAFATLWFAHFTLAALHRLRHGAAAATAALERPALA